MKHLSRSFNCFCFKSFFPWLQLHSPLPHHNQRWKLRMHISYLPPCCSHYEPDTLQYFIKPAHSIRLSATGFVSFNNSPQKASNSICLWMEMAHLDRDVPQFTQWKSLRPPGTGSVVCLQCIWLHQPAKIALCLYSAFLHYILAKRTSASTADTTIYLGVTWALHIHLRSFRESKAQQSPLIITLLLDSLPQMFL